MCLNMRLEHFMGSGKALARLAPLSIGQALPDLQPQQIGTTLLVSVGLGVTPALPGHSL